MIQQSQIANLIIRTIERDMFLPQQDKINHLTSNTCRFQKEKTVLLTQQFMSLTMAISEGKFE